MKYVLSLSVVATFIWCLDFHLHMSCSRSTTVVGLIPAYAEEYSIQLYVDSDLR